MKETCKSDAQWMPDWLFDTHNKNDKNFIKIRFSWKTRDALLIIYHGSNWTVLISNYTGFFLSVLGSD